MKIDTKTTKRYDVTPLFAHPADLDALVNDLLTSISSTKIDYVAAIDALGFVLGTAIAIKLKVGIITIRKGGKLPLKVEKVKFCDYSGQTKELEMRNDVLPPFSQVLIVDEWIETGAQVFAAIQLIEKHQGKVVGIATINMDKNENTRLICSKYKVYTVWEED